MTRVSTSGTTYLTCASTSDTVYGTRASTSDTVYETAVSTSGTTYLTQVSTSDTAYLTRVSTSDTVYYTAASTTNTLYLTDVSTTGEEYETAEGSYEITTTLWNDVKAATIYGQKVPAFRCDYNGLLDKGDMFASYPAYVYTVQSSYYVPILSAAVSDYNKPYITFSIPESLQSATSTTWWSFSRSGNSSSRKAYVTTIVTCTSSNGNTLSKTWTGSVNVNAGTSIDPIAQSWYATDTSFVLTGTASTTYTTTGGLRRIQMMGQTTYVSGTYSTRTRTQLPCISTGGTTWATSTLAMPEGFTLSARTTIKASMTLHVSSQQVTAMSTGTVTTNTIYHTAAVTTGTEYLTAVTTTGTSYLTCASTSDTQYATRLSTSGTEYGTRASTSSTVYLTRVSTSDTSYLTRASTSDTAYGTRISTSDTSYGTRISTSGTTYLTRVSTSATEYLTRASTSGTTYLTRVSTSDTTYLTRVSTSDTTYLTRISTSGTEYGTSVSTSGYSGKLLTSTWA